MENGTVTTAEGTFNYKNDKLHGITTTSEGVFNYRNGVLHDVDGDTPAVRFSDGRVEHYINGVRQQQFAERVVSVEEGRKLIHQYLETMYDARCFA